MSKVFYRKQFSNYLGEQRAIDDIIAQFIPDGGITPTPTPVPVTPTPTPSITPTRTLTPTPTPSVTSTLTPTPTKTGTPTPTPTPTTTTTPTTTPTNTPTVTPTNTSSPTPTPTLTPTPSPITPFSPTSISGITTWFEPTSGVTKSGGFVTNWIDQIGGRNATSTNPTNFTQSNILNSYSGITSPNNNVDSMTFTLLSQSSLTIFSVSQRDALGSNNPQYLIGNASGQGIGAAYDDGTGYKPFIFDGPSGLLLQGGIDPITPKYTTYQLDTSFGQIRQNGTQVAVNAGNPNPQLFTRLFENSGAGFRALQGTIWEIIIYNRILTAPEITQVETYLSTKYGL
jgi:hypothetical protein